MHMIRRILYECNYFPRLMTSMDGVVKHRTERGSAGSTTTNTPENGV